MNLNVLCDTRGYLTRACGPRQTQTPALILWDGRVSALLFVLDVVQLRGAWKILSALAGKRQSC